MNNSKGCIATMFEILITLAILGFLIRYLPIIGAIVSVVALIAIGVIIYKKSKDK